MLDKELAAPAVSGIRSLWNFAQVATGLTPRGLARLLRDANDGDHTAYLTLAEEMEERDPHYAAVLGTHKQTISGLPVVVESASRPRTISPPSRRANSPWEAPCSCS